MRSYRRIKDKPDERDHKFGLTRPNAPIGPLPTRVDLRPHCSPVENQGQTNSCTGQAIVGAMEYNWIVQNPGQALLNLSRLFVYYNERVLANDTQEDQGASIRDGIKSIATWGVCQENDWPFDTNLVLQKPSMEAYNNATKYRAVGYKRVEQNHSQIKQCLAIEQRPIVFGIYVFDSLESDEVAKTGIAPMPRMHENCLGGHAVLLVGYDDATERYLVRNSWGPEWGEGGYFWLPYDYVGSPNLAEDFWMVQSMTD